MANKTRIKQLDEGLKTLGGIKWPYNPASGRQEVRKRASINTKKN